MSTEMEGKLLMPLDKVVINHDLPKFGQAGVLDQMSSDSLTWFSTEPFVMPTGQAYAALRTKPGMMWGPVKIDAVDADTGTILTVNAADYASVSAVQGSALTYVNVGYDNDGEPAAIAFGTADNYVKPFRVVSVSPKSDVDVSVVLTNDDARVYSAETDYTIPSE